MSDSAKSRKYLAPYKTWMMEVAALLSEQDDVLGFRFSLGPSRGRVDICLDFYVGDQIARQLTVTAEEMNTREKQGRAIDRLEELIKGAIKELRSTTLQERLEKNRRRLLYKELKAEFEGQS